MPNGNPTSQNQKDGYKKTKLDKRFGKLSIFVSRIIGSPTWFFFSILIIAGWALSGFFIGFDELWHLYINSTTTILTFLMMSLLHATQSGWESKMERIQKDLKHNLNEIKDEISLEIRGEKKYDKEEKITSIH